MPRSISNHSLPATGITFGALHAIFEESNTFSRRTKIWTVTHLPHIVVAKNGFSEVVPNGLSTVAPVYVLPSSQFLKNIGSTAKCRKHVY